MENFIMLIDEVMKVKLFHIALIGLIGILAILVSLLVLFY